MTAMIVIKTEEEQSVLLAKREKKKHQKITALPQSVRPLGGERVKQRLSNIKKMDDKCYCPSN